MLTQHHPLPRETFEILLKHAIMPTFDLLINYNDEGIIFVKRKIAPYKNVWALPGLRMYKGETIDTTLERIARAELGLTIDPRDKILVGQFTRKFKIELNRQDLSIAYLINLTTTQGIRLNAGHFSEYTQVTKAVLRPTGSMYAYYFKKYQELSKGNFHGKV